MGIFDKLKKPTEETVGDSVAENVVKPTKKPIGTAEIKKAYQTLLDYKKGKTNLEDKIILRLHRYLRIQKGTKDVGLTEYI